MIEQRATDEAQQWGPGDILAVIYTFGYLAMVGAVIYFEIPESNSQMLNTLLTIMSTIQIAIAKCYYDRNRADAQAQRVAAVEQARSSTTMRELAKTVVPATAAAVAAARSEPAAPLPPVVMPVASTDTPAVTPAATNPNTGNTPAAEVATQPQEESKP